VPNPGDGDELLTRARDGGEDALGRLLECYRAYLTLLARVQIGRRLQGKADAADMVQETFLEAARHFPQFRGATEPEFAAWLRQILATRLARLVRHYCGTQARDVRLERMLEDEIDQSSRAIDRGLVAGQTTPSQGVSRREEDRRLAEALEQLPDDYREVIVLRHLEGLTFPEVAQRMGKSLDSVEKLWMRGLARLRQVMEGGP
jgi:RNA polymerase sigma-70 factor (ECF subfamily)